MLYVDLPSGREFAILNRAREDACVSIYLETTPLTQHIETARMQFANLFKTAREQLEELGYDNRFYRMWTYWLHTAAGSDRARRNQLWQMVYSKKGLDNGYIPVR